MQVYSETGYTMVGSTVVLSDGSYSVTGLAAGGYKLNFSPSGTLVPEWWNDKPDYSSATVVTVAAGEKRVGVNASLANGATISGRVSLPDGVAAPLGSLMVTVAPTTSEYSSVGAVRLGADGTYSVTNVPAGTYKVKFSAYGIPALSEWWNDAPDFASATPLTVKAGEVRTGVDARLAASATISGTVTLPQGVPAGQGHVWVTASTPSEPWRNAASAAADQNGAYTLTGLPAGSYIVKFTSFDLPVIPEWWDDARDAASAKPVTVAAGEKRAGVNAALALSHTISGTVTLPAGVTGSSMDVSVSAYTLDQPWSPKASTMASPGGTYVLNGLEPGTYKLRFSADRLNVLTQWWKEKPDFDSATAMVLGSRNITGVDVKLRKSASISGTITVPEGVRADQIAVSAVPTSNEWGTSFQGQVGSDGRYIVTGLPAGSFKVRFSSWQAPVLDEWWKDATDFARAQSVTLASGQDQSGIDASLARSSSLSGTIGRSGGAPVAGVTIEVYRRSDDGSWQWTQQTTTASTGTYSFPRLSPGTYTLHAKPPTGDLLPEYYNDKPSLATASALTVDSGSRRDVTANMTLAAGATVSGTVRYADGSPMAGAPVTLYSRTATRVGSATTDAAGGYTVVGVSGDVTAGVGAGGGMIYAGSTSILAGATFVTVAKTAKIDVKVPGVTVSGSVTVDGTRAPASGGTVRLSSPQGGYSAAATVGADGRYRLRGVIAGSYTAQFTPADGSGLTSTWSGGGADSGTAVAFDVASTAVTKNLVALSGGTVVAALPSGPGSSTYRGLQLYRWVDGTAQYTASAGGTPGSSVRIDALAPGTYTASVDGVYLGGAVTTDTAQRFTVAGGKVIDLGTFDATPRGTAGALTVTATGASYSARIVLVSSGGRVYDPSRSSTGSNSMTSSFAVPVGTYRVFGSSTSAGVVDTWYGGTSNLTAKKITVRAGETSSVSFALAVGDASVTGKVLDAIDRTAVASAIIQLTPLDRVPAVQDRGSAVTIRTDSLGAFSFASSLRAGTSYRIDVRLPSGAVLATRTFTAKAGTQAMTFTTPRTGVLQGKVANASSGIAVVLWRDGDTESMGGRWTDETGSYRFEGLPAGSYRVQFTRADLDSASSYAPGWASTGRTREEAAVIKVAAGATVSAPLTELGRAGIISGRVAAAPTKGATTWVSTLVTVKDGAGRTVTTGRSDGGSPGGYAIEAPPGSYTVCARPVGSPATFVEACRSGVTVTAGKQTQRIDLTMRPAPSRTSAVATGPIAPW
ncbi:hypothetical protein MTES_1475 [Microbacterium testaceum StLB037]|uniref:alpha-amylase n=1 Tax=Microbacterium testaceum (strain StLB037) TaxID=979556 RepID=E8N903_MICTS|nr:carboxypeptidase regulatory-like domain-containing protein [Microbacterium testaceum]BAJ74439.1 hypothetical protein MTES_1475 [Microbacterium testaceum StLB037]